MDIDYWTGLSPSDLQKILSSVWCSSCEQSTTMKNYSVERIYKGLILSGQCVRCENAVARFVEAEE